MGSWSVALTFALVMAYGGNGGYHGFWSIAKSAGDNSFCWVKDGRNDINWQEESDVSPIPYVFFYVPLMLVYGYTIFVLNIAFNKLRRGISATFSHRVRVLVMNCTNILVFLLYWIILLVLYTALYYTNSANLFKLLLFGLSTKGMADGFVWVLTMDVNAARLLTFGCPQLNFLDDGTEDITDLNKALRTEA